MLLIHKCSIWITDIGGKCLLAHLEMVSSWIKSNQKVSVSARHIDGSFCSKPIRHCPLRCRNQCYWCSLLHIFTTIISFSTFGIGNRYYTSYQSQSNWRRNHFLRLTRPRWTPRSTYCRWNENYQTPHARNIPSKGKHDVFSSIDFKTYVKRFLAYLIAIKSKNIKDARNCVLYGEYFIRFDCNNLKWDHHIRNRSGKIRHFAIIIIYSCLSKAQDSRTHLNGESIEGSVLKSKFKSDVS